MHSCYFNTITSLDRGGSSRITASDATALSFDVFKYDLISIYSLNLHSGRWLEKRKRRSETSVSIYNEIKPRHAKKAANYSSKCPYQDTVSRREQRCRKEIREKKRKKNRISIIKRLAEPVAVVDMLKQKCRCVQKCSINRTHRTKRKDFAGKKPLSRTSYRGCWHRWVPGHSRHICQRSCRVRRSCRW